MNLKRSNVPHSSAKILLKKHLKRIQTIIHLAVAYRLESPGSFMLSSTTVRKNKEVLAPETKQFNPPHIMP